MYSDTIASEGEVANPMNSSRFGCRSAADVEHINSVSAWLHYQSAAKGHVANRGNLASGPQKHTTHADNTCTEVLPGPTSEDGDLSPEALQGCLIDMQQQLDGHNCPLVLADKHL